MKSIAPRENAWEDTEKLGAQEHITCKAFDIAAKLHTPPTLVDHANSGPNTDTPDCSSPIEMRNSGMQIPDDAADNDLLLAGRQAFIESLTREREKRMSRRMAGYESGSSSASEDEACEQIELQSVSSEEMAADTLAPDDQISSTVLQEISGEAAASVELNGFLSAYYIVTFLESNELFLFLEELSQDPNVTVEDMGIVCDSCSLPGS